MNILDTIKPAGKFRLTNRLARAIVIVLGSLALALYLVQGGLSYRELIVALGAFIVGVIVFGGARGISFGFVLWVLTLALGYRTLAVTPSLRIHPAEMLLWLLMICLIVHRELMPNHIGFPTWLWLFIPFCVLAWWPVIWGDAPWDRMLNEFRNFALLIPLIILAPVVLARPKMWKYLVGVFFLVSTWIAVMGVIEYWFPSITEVFPAFIKDAKAEPTADGFVRAQFSFWGSQSATFICALATPTAIILATWFRRSWQRISIAAAAVVQLVAIYIGGYRSVWLLVLIQALIALTFGVRRHGLVLAGLCLVVAVTGYQYIPNSHERLMSGVAAFQGAPVDHSALDRKERALDAVDRVMSSPLGGGWSSAGWVHSDFLQVAVNLGIIAALIFASGYLYTLFRLARRVLFLRFRHDPQQEHLGFALLLSFIAVGALLATQGVEVLTQLVLPVWFVWALVEVWLRQTSEVFELSYSYAPANLYPVAHFQ